MNISENGVYSPSDYDDSHLRGISRPSNPSAAEHGGVKHFGYPITDDQHDRNTTFTECDDCHTPLWKRQLDGEVWCSSCNRVYVERGGQPTSEGWGMNVQKQSNNETTKTHLRTTANGSQTAPYTSSHERYDTSATLRMYGGYFGAYQGDGNYEFGDLNDGILDDAR